MGVTFASPLIVLPVPGGNSGASSYTPPHKDVIGVITIQKSATIKMGLDAAANNPDWVSHEFGHYVADAGHFLGGQNETHYFFTNQRMMQAGNSQRSPMGSWGQRSRKASEIISPR